MFSRMKRDTFADPVEWGEALFQLAVETMIERYREQYPRASDAFIAGKVEEWLLDKPAPAGRDLVEVPWPRSRAASSASARSRVAATCGRREPRSS